MQMIIGQSRRQFLFLSLKIENGSFKWGRTSTPTLTGINLNVKPGVNLIKLFFFGTSEEAK
jgi:hypothetical protein